MACSSLDPWGRLNRSSPDRSSCLLRQNANVGHDVLHFSIGELAAPRMHRAEDNAVFDRTKEFFIGFQERLKALKISRRNFQGSGVGSIAPTSRAMTVLAVTVIHSFPAPTVGWIVLSVQTGCRGTAEDEDAEEACCKEPKSSEPLRSCQHGANSFS